jgi:hypothetical protein
MPPSFRPLRSTTPTHLLLARLSPSPLPLPPTTPLPLPFPAHLTPPTASPPPSPSRHRLTTSTDRTSALHPSEGRDPRIPRSALLVRLPITPRIIIPISYSAYLLTLYRPHTHICLRLRNCLHTLVSFSLFPLILISCCSIFSANSSSIRKAQLDNGIPKASAQKSARRRHPIERRAVSRARAVILLPSIKRSRARSRITPFYFRPAYRMRDTSRTHGTAPVRKPPFRHFRSGPPFKPAGVRASLCHPCLR